MPVEIKELIIRAVVESEDEATAVESGAEASAPDMEKAIEACVKQVLKILKRSKER